MMPFHFIYEWMRVDDTVEVDVRPFANGVGVQGGAQDYPRLGGICNTSSNYRRIMTGNCHLDGGTGCLGAS